MDPNEPAPPETEPYDPHSKIGNALTVTQPGERTVCEIKRHPIGILGIYVSSGVLLLVVAVLGLVVAPHYLHDSSGRGHTATTAGALIFLIVAVLCLAYTLIASKVYWGNSWVVTTDSITQIEQVSLFNRQSSQLSLGNLEDVTAEQKGVLPHMFNYGLLRVETAGERSKFVFRYCPNPNYYAQQVLSARENFEQGRRGADSQRTYRGEGSYGQPQVPPEPQSAPPFQAGDPGYGAYQPPQPQPQPQPQAPEGNTQPTAPADYPSDSTDQGLNINT